MDKVIQSARMVRFANFELDLDAGELRKNGLRLKFSGQPFEVLAILLEQPGAIVTREQLQKRLWPDSFVDFDHNLNSAINRIREALGDSAETPRFVELCLGVVIASLRHLKVSVMQLVASKRLENFREDLLQGMAISDSGFC